MGVITAIIDWINKDTISLYENRLQAVVIRCTSLLSMVYYLFISVLFLINGQYIIGFYDLAGIFVLMYSVYLTYHKHVKQAFWIYSADIVFLVAFQVLYVGWNVGWQYSLFLLVIVSFFTTYYSVAVKLLLSVSYAIIYCSLYIYTRMHMPYVALLNGIDYYLSIVTIVYCFGSLAVAGFYFSAKSSGMEKKLVEYNKTLERLAFFDPLTGLYNRRQTVSFLEKKLDAMKDDPSGLLTVVIGDIDFFKKVNDVYGHECGDIVLKEVASILKNGVRKRGLASRWGGEEFLMIFPEKDRDNAVSYINEIMNTIRAHEVEYCGQIVKVTMSFGVAQYDKGLTIDEIIKNADMKLYEAKETGRNKVVY